MLAANCKSFYDLYLFTLGTCQRKLYNFRHISQREVRLLLLRVPRPTRLKMYSQMAEHSHEPRQHLWPHTPPLISPKLIILGDTQVHSKPELPLRAGCSSPCLLPGTAPKSWLTLAPLQLDIHTHTLTPELKQSSASENPTSQPKVKLNLLKKKKKKNNNCIYY